jgi:ribonuclease HII
MPWLVGVDEAGYGPNLGPFVMSSVAIWIPEFLADRRLWKLLKDAVRSPAEQPDARIEVGDSKLVYTPARGLSRLEAAVLSFLAGTHGELPTNVEGLLGRCTSNQNGFRGELWFRGADELPVECDPSTIRQAGRQLAECAAGKGLRWGPVHTVVMGAARFNELADHWQSKAGAPRQALAELIGGHRQLGENNEPIWFFIDKQGGRNSYGAMLQDALGDGFVAAHEEGMQRSRYSVLGLERELRFTFQPRADSEHFAVALASMVSKYVRELLMRDFNAFWRQRVPDLRPTAGYPGDAVRFYEAIRPHAERLAIPADAIWRRR